MKILRNCVFIGILAALSFLLLVVSYSFFLPHLSLGMIVLSTMLVFSVFELGVLAGVVIIKISSAAEKN